jgi:tetratricopeptide (TPR) repeat protein
LADSLLDEAIRLDPNGMWGWTGGGWTKVALGNHQTAIDHFQRALRLSPLDPRIFFAQTGLAYAYFFLGKYEEGLKCAADALRHHPSFVRTLRATMACHAMLGNIGAAQNLWRQVAVLSPSDRVSETRKRVAFRDQDVAKLQKAYRLAGMPEWARRAASQRFGRRMSLLPEGASGVVNNPIPLAETLLLLPRQRRQLSAFDFEIASTSAYKKGPGEP